MSQLGRISGPLLKANLLRQGVDLAFENDLLYLDVNNLRVGIKTTSPTHDLQVVGTTRTTNLEVTNTLQLGNLTISDDTIESSTNLTLNTAGTDGSTRFEGSLTIDAITIYDNVVSSNISNANIELRPSGTGRVEIFADTSIFGDIIYSGDVEIDGNATIGDDETDTITFNSKIIGNLIPNQDDTFDLGSSDLSWRNIYIGKMIIDDIEINDNYIQTTVSDANLELRANGTGSVSLEDVYFNNNVIRTEGSDNLEIRPADTLDIYADTNITCNLYVTGNIRTDGNIIIGDQNTDSITVNADIASNVIPDVDATYNLGSPSKRWDALYTDVLSADTVLAGTIILDNVRVTEIQGNIVYVAQGGNDTNTGTHQNDPWRTIKYALSQVESGDTIYIYPGEYEEVFPLEIPVGVTVKGVGLRSVTIKPDSTSVYEDVFLLNGETTVEDITIKGFLYDSINNKGHAFRLANNFKVSSRSPYIRNISVITEGSVTSIDDPRGFDEGDAGKGAYLDGSVADPDSIEVGVLFHSATFITPNVESITMTNGLRVEWLNCFTYFADKGLYAVSGTTGFAGQGRTMIKLSEVTGTILTGDTLTYTSSDGSTILATGTVDEVVGNKIFLDGKVSGLEEAAERSGKVVTVYGNAQLSTSVKQFGSAALYLNNTAGATATDYATLEASNDFNFSTEDFAVEFFVYKQGTGAEQILFDMRSTAVQVAPVVKIDSLGRLRYFINGTDVLTPTAVVPTGFWTHIALTRSAGQTRLFLNGFQAGSAYVDSNNYGSLSITIGSGFDQSSAFQGYIDELRISKGVARYASNFAVPISEFRSDNDTVLLLHCNGTNGSVVIEDDGIVAQDISFSGGASANFIELTDYSDFGAEIRSIGSANIYGNYGVYGDGLGVIAYLIGHNFAYIGTGKDSSNDVSLVIQVNEIEDINGAKIYFTSVDHKGDFRVGDLFYVNQETGQVQFTSALINFEGNGLTFVGDIYTTVIDGDKVQTGNLRLSGNTLESIAGDINLEAESEQIVLQNNVSVTGNLDVSGNVIVGGNITVGDQTTDTLEIVAKLDSDIIPSVDSRFNLGSSALAWETLYASRLEISDIQIDTNVIKTVSSNADLELRSSGTGNVLLDNFILNDNVISVNTSELIIDTDTRITEQTTVENDLTVEDNLTVQGNTQLGSSIIDDTVTVNASISSDLVPNNTSYNLGSLSDNWNILYVDTVQTDDIKIQGNKITTTASNSNLELQAAGTGSIIVEDISFNQNTISSTTNIIIAPSTELEINGNALINGNLDVTGDVTIGGNINFGNQTSDLISFIAEIESDIVPQQTGTYNLGSETKSWNIIYADSAQIADIQIQTNVIQTTVSNSDLELRSNGTGLILLDNVSIKDNTLQTQSGDLVIDSAGIIQLNQSTEITGDLSVTGNIDIGGNITFGNETSDTISFVSNLTSSIIPSENDVYDLGSDIKRWRSSYLGSAIIDDIEINDNYIRTTTSNADLELRASGTGSIKIDDIAIKDNIIEVTTANDLILKPTGTGKVNVDSTTSFRIPRGTTAERPSPAYAGMIRFNTELNQYEGYNGTAWLVLNGVYDQDGDTYIAPEVTPGANDNRFYFYAGGSLIAELDSTSLDVTRVDVDDIRIDGNTIQTITSDTDLEFQPQGTGRVKIGNFAISNNAITNIVADSISTISQTGNGYFKIEGTNGVVIPSGSSFEKPAYAVLGMTRFSTTAGQVEIYNGTAWVSVAGAAGPVTIETAIDSAITYALTLG